MFNVLKREMTVVTEVGFKNLRLSRPGKAPLKGIKILEAMVKNGNEFPANSVLKAFGADCLNNNHPDGALQSQQSHLNALPLDLQIVDVYSSNGKGEVSAVKRYDMRAIAQFNTRTDILNKAPEEQYEDYEICFNKVFDHLLHGEFLVELYNPEDSLHRTYITYRTTLQTIAGKRGAQAMPMATSFKTVAGKMVKDGKEIEARPVSELLIQPKPFSIITPGQYFGDIGHGRSTWAKLASNGQFLKDEHYAWDLSKSEKRYTVGHSSGSRVAPFSTDFKKAITEYGIPMKGIVRVGHSVKEIKGLGKFDVYELFLATPFEYKYKFKGKETIKEVPSFKIAVLKADAISFPELKGYKAVDVTGKTDAEADEQKKNSSLGFMEIPEEVVEFYNEGAKEVMDFVEVQKKDKSKKIEDNPNVADMLDKGNIVTDGSMYHNRIVGQFFFKNMYLGASTQGFQFRANPADKGMSVLNDMVTTRLGVDMVMFKSAKKAPVHHEWFVKQNFQFAILNKTNHAAHSFKALPSSVVQNLMLDMNKGKKIIDDLRDEAFVQAKKAFSNTEAAYLEFRAEDDEVEENLFGYAKTLKANPQLIHDKYHREGIAKDLLKPLRKTGEGYVYLNGTRTLYLACDSIAVDNALADGSVLVDEKGFITAIVIDKKHCEIQKGQVVVADLAKKGKEAKKGEALFARTPQQSAEEFLLAEMVSTPKYEKALRSGHFLGFALLSAMDWSAAQMSGADYDGDFAFIIEVMSIVSYFKKYYNRNKLMPKLNKYIRFNRDAGILELGDGCPFKGTKVITGDRYIPNSDWLIKDLGLAEYTGKFEVYEDLKKGTFHAEFAKDMPEAVCNEIVARFNSRIVARSLTLNDIGILANRLMLLQELRAYYVTLMEEVIATNSTAAISKLIIHEHIGKTVNQVVRWFEDAIADIEDMKDCLQIAAWYEIDAPKHGGAYKAFVQNISLMFGAVDVAGLARESRIYKVFEEKGAFAPLFFHQSWFNGKLTKLNPVKPKWLANQKQESRYNEYKYVVNGEERHATPISLYAQESEAILDQGEKVIFKDELANSVGLIPVFEEVFGKTVLAQYSLFARELSVRIREVGGEKDKQEKALKDFVNANLSKKDLTSKHMKLRQDKVKAIVKREMPAEVMKIKKRYAESVQAILTEVGQKAVAAIPNFDGTVLFAMFLQFASKGTNAKPGVAWNILENYAIELVKSDAFKAAYQKAIDAKANAVKPVVESTPAEETKVETPVNPVPTKREPKLLPKSEPINHEVTHEAPAEPAPVSPKRGHSALNLPAGLQLDHEVK